MIDRIARTRMSSALRSYMAEEMTAFELDDALTEVIDSTNDATVQRVGEALWFCYDDCKDHKVVAAKDEWDYFNRLLLLLESDAELGIATWKRWRFSQAVAAACLACFGGMVALTGFGDHLLLVTTPLGAVSMLIAWLESRSDRKRDESKDFTAPFPCLASLLRVRRRVACFGRIRYPASVATRQVRDPALERAMQLQNYMMWLLFSPVALLFQILPRTEVDTAVRIPGCPPPLPLPGFDRPTSRGETPQAAGTV